MAEKFQRKEYYDNLARLFKNGPKIRHRIANKVLSPGESGTPIGTAKAFLKNTNSIFSSQIAAYGTFNRNSRYSDYQEMQSHPICASALDIIADECTVKDEYGRVLKVTSQNRDIRRTLEILFNDVLNIEFNSWLWIRNLAKYGDQFLLLDHHPDYGILNALPLPVNEIEREEAFDPEDPFAFRFRYVTQGNRIMDSWQVVHFRMAGADEFLPYGVSYLEPARRPWRQLCHAPNTKVLTDGGWKYIKDVNAGDYVYSFDYSEKRALKTKVKHCVSMGVQDLVRVKTLHRQIDVTPNHGLLVYNPRDKRFEYKKAKDLQTSGGEGGYRSSTSDKLVLPFKVDGNDNLNIEVKNIDKYYVKLTNKHECDRTNIVDILKNLNTETGYRNVHAFLQSNRKISYKDFLKIKDVLKIDISNCNLFWNKNNKKAKARLSECGNKILWNPENIQDFVRFFGFMLGDGWLDRNTVGFALGVYEEQNQKYTKILSSLNPDKSIILNEAKKFSGGNVNITSGEIVYILKQLGFITGFANKRVPQWVFDASPELRKQFIEGFIDADGDDNGRINIANYNLISDLQTVCQMTGIPVGIIGVVPRKEKIINGIKTVSKESYRINVSLKNCVDLREKRFELENVISVEDLPKDETYDLEVDHEVHNFTANGIITHNTLMEDAIMVYRVVRSPERRVFYVDVGNIPPKDVPQYMETVKTQLKRSQVVDSTSGRVDLRYHAITAEDDYFIPKRGAGENSTRIDTLAGGQFTGDVEDIEYFKSKLISALKIPKSYIGYDEGIGSKSQLSMEDVRFARTIQRIQRVLLSELNKIAVIHLYSKGYTGEDLTNFDLSMTNPSTISEIQQLELWRTRFEAAQAAQEGLLSKKFIYKHLFRLSDEDIAEVEEQRKEDRELDAEIEAIQAPTPEGEAPQQGGEEPAPAGAEEAPPEQPEEPEGMGAGEPQSTEPLDANAGETAVTDARDPNIQRAMPNELKGGVKRKEKVSELPDLLKYTFGTKKTGLDFKKTRRQLRSDIVNPFGESVEEEEDDIVERNFSKNITELNKLTKNLEKIGVIPAVRKEKKIL